MKQHSRLTLIVALLGIVAITVLAYYPGMAAGFYFDDLQNILHAPALHWTEFSLSNVSSALREAQITSRPVANITLAFNHLASGLDPAPYHWTNLVIHLAAGLALFWVITLFQRHHGVGHQNIALLAVLLFLVHPLNIQATTYVVQRMTSLATLFVLLSLGSYISGRFRPDTASRWTWFVLAGICFLLAAGSKEIGFLLLPLLLLYEACFNSTELFAGYRRMVARFGKYPIVLGGSLVLVAIGWLGWTFAGDSFSWTETMQERDYTGIERVLTQGRVQFFYLSLLLWPAPSRLNLDHAFTVSRSLVDPLTTLLAFLFIAATIIFALRSIRSRPLLAFPVLGYWLLHSMESGPVNLELVFEHRMYMLMTMLALLVGLNLRPASMKHALTTYAILLVVGALLAASTYQRNLVWGDPLTFHRDTAAKSPEKFRPQYNLGTNLGVRGILGEAETAFEQAVRIKPDSSLAHNQLGNVYLLKNQLGLAEQHYRRSIENDPDHAEPLFNLARLLMSQGRYEEQQELLERFVDVAPPHLEKQKQWALQQLGR
jgi:cytochrome c-type biogenesis protein CcmH/NrfG